MVSDLGLERDYVPITSGPSAAGAAATVVVEKRPGCRIQVGSLSVSYSAAPAGGRLTCGETGSIRYDVDVAAAGPYDPTLPDDGWTFEPGQEVTATAAGGGGAIIAKVNLSYRYIRHR